MPNERPKAAPADLRWYQLPLAWFGIAIFTASLAGCAWIIVLGTRYPDDSLPASDEHLFKMPATRALEDSP
jgi:hypothetical protein